MKNKSRKETLWSFSSKGITFLLFFFLNTLLARTLGVEDFGTWSFFLSIITIIYTISYFGVNASVRKFVAQHNHTTELRAVVQDGVKARSLLSLGAIIVFILISWPLSRLLNKPEFFQFFVFSIPLIFFAGTTQFIKEVFMGLHRTKYNLIINLCEHGGKILIITLLFLFSISVNNVIIGFSIAFTVSTIIGSWIIYQNFYKNLASSTSQYFSQIIRYSIPFFFISLGFLLLTEVDTMMLGILTNDNEVGIYAVPKQISIKIPQIALALAMGSMPVFAQLSSDNKSQLQKLFQKLLTINGVFMLLFLIGAFGLSQWFIPLIFGAEYTDSIVVFRILSIYTTFASFSILFDHVLDYQGLAQNRALNMIIVVIGNVVLNYILIPEYGALGAALSTTISFIPYVIMNGIQTLKILYTK